MVVGALAVLIGFGVAALVALVALAVVWWVVCVCRDAWADHTDSVHQYQRVTDDMGRLQGH